MFSLVNRIVSVWTNENRVSSDSQTRQAVLANLEREDVKGLYGKLVEIDGPISDGIESCSVFQPGREVTNNCFDKGQAYHSLNSVQEYLTAIGIKLPQIMTEVDETTNEVKAFPVRAHVNAVSDLNAWYSPQTKDLTFGTYGEMSKGQDRWHLGADNDVSIHEFGHLALDQIAPKLGSGWGGEGRAIHEGFADALAALYADDPEMSEDFSVALGRPPNKKDGLRIVDNNLTLDDVTSEEHDRGRVYAGFFWAIKKCLVDPNGPFKMESKAAADLVLKIMFNHAALYSTSRPAPADFVSAVVKAVDAIKSNSPLPSIDMGALKSFIMAEADKRKMLKPKDKKDGDMEPGEDAASKNANIKFVPIRKTPFIGGSYEIYQQQYKTARGVYADVVDGAIHVQKNNAGRPVLISSRDVKTIKPGEINERINISPSKAASLALGDAYQKLNASQRAVMTLWSGRRKDFLKSLAVLQMEHRMAEKTIKTLSGKGFARPNIKLAIIPDSSDLHYEIKSGLGIYYVNARTGSVKFHKDVFVN